MSDFHFHLLLSAIFVTAGDTFAYGISVVNFLCAIYCLVKEK